MVGPKEVLEFTRSHAAPARPEEYAVRLALVDGDGLRAAAAEIADDLEERVAALSKVVGGRVVAAPVVAGNELEAVGGAAEEQATEPSPAQDAGHMLSTGQG